MPGYATAVTPYFAAALIRHFRHIFFSRYAYTCYAYADYAAAHAMHAFARPTIFSRLLELRYAIFAAATDAISPAANALRHCVMLMPP